MPIKQKELCAHWGCSAAYVSQRVKRGCPLDSIESADRWRLLHATRGVGFRSRPEATCTASRLIPPPEDVGTGLPPAVEKLSSLRDVLDASVHVQSEAYRLFRQAAEGTPEERALVGLHVTAYAKATESRLATEKAVQALEIRAGLIVPREKARELALRMWPALLSRLRSLANGAGVRVAPGEAEEIVEEARRLGLAA